MKIKYGSKFKENIDMKTGYLALMVDLKVLVDLVQV